MPRLPRLAAGAAALCALAIAAPAANADSIAYVKDGNIYLSTSDGARQFQVTSDGGYSDVSQADDGTMIGLHGLNLRKLDRQGAVLADFATPVSDARPAPAKTFYGPFDPAISPDGTKVAYSYYYMTQSQSPTCFPPTCYTTINEGGTGYTHADRLTGWDEPGFRKHSGWRFPIWVDNATTILSNPTHLPNDDVVVDVPRGHERRPRAQLVHRRRPGQPGRRRRRHHARPAQAGVPDRREQQHAERLLALAGRPHELARRRGQPGDRSDRLLPLRRPDRRRVRHPQLRA